jgi:hypothetical protein
MQRKSIRSINWSSKPAGIGYRCGKVVINAVMAGCRAEYMLVIVAAVEALADRNTAITVLPPAPAAGGVHAAMVRSAEIDINSATLPGPGWRQRNHRARFAGDAQR